MDGLCWLSSSAQATGESHLLEFYFTDSSAWYSWTLRISRYSTQDPTSYPFLHAWECFLYPKPPSVDLCACCAPHVEHHHNPCTLQEPPQRPLCPKDLSKCSPQVSFLLEHSLVPALLIMPGWRSAWVGQACALGICLYQEMLQPQLIGSLFP